MYTRKSSVVALVSLLVLTSAGLGSSAVAQSISAEFPEATFPEKIFGGLSGEVLFYDTSGGPTTEARNTTLFRRFTELTGVQFRSDFYADPTKFYAWMQNGTPPPWSLIELPGTSELNRAKAAGYLEKLDPALVPLDKLDPGAVDEYGIRIMNYSIQMIWNTEAFPESGPKPQSWADFYDLEKFPGKRCMYKSAQTGATLESALLADGVKPDQLYPLDVDRAFKKLDTIKDQIVWWTSGAQGIQYLTSGECQFGVSWNGRIASAIKEDKAPIGLSWNQALYSSAVLAVPKGAPNSKAGQAAIAMWILDKRGQIDYVSRLPYATNIKALSLDDYPAEVRQYLVGGDNLKNAIAEDTAYYEEHLPELTDRLNAWLQR